MNYKKPRGTQDWYGDSLEQLNEVLSILNSLVKAYGFQNIMTPTFESLDLFKKSVGDTTDIVQKELYTFVDKKGRKLALRPEGTSSVVRAYVEDKMFANKSNVTKLAYFLNLFRYERPQNGRLREFHQFGIEYLNVNSHLNDIECLILAQQIINKFNLSKYIQLKINYLGNFEQRQLWIKELKQYFVKYQDQLTDDSLQRLNINPLRILDDKIDGQKSFVKQAPKLEKFLNDEDNKIFKEILNCLSSNEINYFVDDSLVRGLDYYTGIVFEFVYKSPVTELESTLLGGGRYSHLIQQTGGPDQIGLGFAIGIERLLLALNETNYSFKNKHSLDIVLGFDSFKTTTKCLSMITKIRENNYCVEIDFGNYKKDKNARFAIRQNAKYFSFIDENDLKNNVIKLENIKTHELINVNLDKLVYFLKGEK